MSGLLPLLATLLLAAPGEPVTAKPVVVDKVVAFVASRPITLSEVELELRLERAAAGDVMGAVGTVTPTQLADALPDLIDRTIVLRGMQTQYVDTLEPGIVDRQVAKMRETFGENGWKAFLALLEMTEDEVRERRRRVLESGTIFDAAVNDALNVKREDLENFLAEHPDMTREQAEKQLLAEMEERVRRDLLERKKRDLQAVIVDSIVKTPVPPEKDAP